MTLFFLTVNYYTATEIAQLLASLAAQGEMPDWEFVIVNNSPDDRGLAALAGHNLTILETGENRGFGAACNVGLQWIWARDREATVWSINPDTLIPPGMVAQMQGVVAAYPQVTILGTGICNRMADGQAYWVRGGFASRSGWIGEYPIDPLDAVDVVDVDPAAKAECYLGNVVPVAWTSACSMVLQFRNFRTCPDFDPEFFLYYEDFDFCRRYARAGCRVAATDAVWVVHRTSSATGRDPEAKRRQEIASYLLALEKHYPLPWLLYRLLRLAATGLASLLQRSPEGRAKLSGLARYLRHASRHTRWQPLRLFAWWE